MNITELKKLVSRYKEITNSKKAIESVKQDGYSLQFVKDQTEEICLEAVKQNCDSLQFVKDQTEEICLEAVKQNGDSLKFVKIFDFKPEVMTLKEVCEELGRDIVIKLTT